MQASTNLTSPAQGVSKDLNTIGLSYIAPRQQHSTRVPKACVRCRILKARCDDLHPNCSRCASVGLTCEKSYERSRREYPPTYTEYLESRAFSLEIEVERLRKLVRQEAESRILVPRHETSPESMEIESTTDSPVTRTSTVDSEVGEGNAFIGNSVSASV